MRNDLNMPSQYKVKLERANGLLKCKAEILSQDPVNETIETDRRQHSVTLFGVPKSKEAKHSLRYEF